MLREERERKVIQDKEEEIPEKESETEQRRETGRRGKHGAERYR